jgi:hypothetical protein
MLRTTLETTQHHGEQTLTRKFRRNAKEKKKSSKGIEISREQQCSNKSLPYIIYAAREC